MNIPYRHRRILTRVGTLLGILLVYFVMVAQFQSLKSPFIVMFTIPLAFTGGFAALILGGMEVSVRSEEHTSELQSPS